MPATDHITETDRAFIAQQRLFFVATAPRSDEGLVNLSPKGLRGTFAILDERTVAYLDLTGSGVETIAHLKENGRICLMCCAFEGKPNILRLQGRGEVIEPHHAAFATLRAAFGDFDAEGDAGIRSIIRVHVQRVSNTCGFGVPRMTYVGDRTELTDWAAKLGPTGIAAYQAKKNRRSLDGLPGV